MTPKERFKNWYNEMKKTRYLKVYNNQSLSIKVRVKKEIKY